MRDKIRSLSIRHKIILSIYLVLFPVLIIAEALTYYNNYNEIMNERMRQYNGAAESISRNLGYMVQDMLDIGVYFSVSSDIQTLLGGDIPPDIAANPLFWDKMTSVGVIKNILAVKTKITTVALYPENGLKYFSSSRDKSVYAPSIERIRGLDIYERAVEAKGGLVWVRTNTDESGLYIKNSSDKIIMCRELFDLSKQRRLGFLSMSIDVGDYEAICRSAMVQEGEKLLMLDSDGNELLNIGGVDGEFREHIAMDKTSRLRRESGAPYEFKGFYVFSAHMPQSDVWVCYITAKSNWQDWMRSGLMTPILLALALLLSTIPLSALASRVISKPLMALHKSMERFKDGDFEQKVAIDGKDEIAELADTFNGMVLEMRKLIDKNNVMLLMEKESELNALQAQINPHFLYNALDSLYWQALDSGQNRLAEDVLSLSELFRVMLSSGKSEISVEKELGIVRHYLHIQKMRFDKKLDYSIDVDGDMMAYPMPKLILQPFVENAITHGLENRASWGFVNVKGRLKDGRLCFTVSDNGAGMSQEKVARILSSGGDDEYANQRVGSYAIRNVKERMNLRYSGHATLSIDSKPGVGTSVNIEIPVATAHEPRLDLAR